MFERYLDQSRHAIFVARTEADHSGSSEVRSEHLLLGIVQATPGLLPPPLELAIRSRLGSGSHPSPDLTFSLAAKMALARAAEAATRLGHSQIAPIHILMGLLQDEESLATELLKAHGISASQVEALSLNPPAPPAEPMMMQMIAGFWTSRSIYVAAQLGIADRLKDGPKSASELAASTGSHAEALYRLLRALASVGIFAEQEGQRFANTPLSQTLEEKPGTLRYFAISELGQEHYAAWEDFPYSVRTGGLAFTEKFKQPIWEYYAAHPEHADNFNRSMSTLTEWVIAEIQSAYDFTPFHKIVDIGGGHGAFLAAILGKAPEARGVLFDAPPVIAKAIPLPERGETAVGNFFETVPTGGDLYTLKMIFHDWNDDQCHTILTNIRRSIVPHGKLLVVETVLGPGSDAPFKNFLDLNMMVMTGGQERTAARLAAILEKAGFTLTRVIPTHSPISIVEAVVSA